MLRRDPQSARPLRPSAAALAISGAIALGVGALSSVGLLPPATPIAGIASMLLLVFTAGLIAASYMLAGVGIGRGVSRLLGRLGVASLPLFVQASLGVGVLVWMSHLLGVFGALSGRHSQWVGWGVVVLGVLGLVADIGLANRRISPPQSRGTSAWWHMAVPGIAVLVVAASNPPGGLWRGPDSEAGAYDAQSYHLALPKEWAAGATDGGTGRLWPVEHNVYSYLPGYAEGAFLHIAAMTGAGKSGGGDFVAGTGTGVIACQYLHALFGVLAMLGIADAARRLIGRTFLSRETPSGQVDAVATLTGATLMSLPWVGVVGSLAYNELTLVTMTIAAVSLSAWTGPASATKAGAPEPDAPTWLQGLGVGFLVGIACSAKPTALFFSAPLAGLCLVGLAPMPLRRVLGLVAFAVVGGMIAIGPWLVRNYLAAGNPVFPFLHSVFGNSHWNAEQLARYAHAHSFDGSWAERLQILLSTARGVLHPLWFVLFPVGGAALVIGIARRATRRVAIILTLGLVAQLAAWLSVTHLQSRFLIPASVPLCLGIAIAGAGAITAVRPSRRAVALCLMAAVPAALALAGVRSFLSQNDGRPNTLLVPGVESITGRTFTRELASLSADQREQALNDNAGAIIAAYFRLGPEDSLYMVGGATPLYYLPGGTNGSTNGVANVWYNTTWDGSPLSRAIREHPDDAAAWSRAVRAAMESKLAKTGRRLRHVYVLIDQSEINRLRDTTTHKADWFDSVITIPLLTHWMDVEAEPVQAWPEPATGGMFLFRLKGTAR